MKTKLEFGRCYRVTLKDESSFRFIFKGNLPAEDILLPVRPDDYLDVFGFKGSEFKSIEKCL